MQAKVINKCIVELNDAMTIDEVILVIKIYKFMKLKTQLDIWGIPIFLGWLRSVFRLSGHKQQQSASW